MDYENLKASDGTGDAVLAHITATRAIGNDTIAVDSVAGWPDQFIVTTGTLDANGYLDPADTTQMIAHLVGSDIIIDSFEPGYSDLGNTDDQVAIIKQTTGWADRVVALAQVAHNDDGTLKDDSVDSIDVIASATQLSLLALAYPVGSIYINAAVATNPGTLLGFGTWAAFGTGRVMIGINAADADFDTLEETGGAKTASVAHTHSVAGTTTVASAGTGVTAGGVSVPTGTHTHDLSVTSGAMSVNATPSVVQPYIVVHMWKRTA